MSITYLYVMLY